MLKILITLIIFFNLANAVMIGTGSKQKEGTLLLANYYIDFQSDIIKDNSRNAVINNFNWRERTYVFKPVYYTKNFLFHLTIPYRKTQRGFTNEKVEGIYDISAGVGYFIPNSYGDLLWISNIQFPTGDYDKNKSAVLGGTTPALQLGLNRYELQEELHFFKPVLTTKIPFVIDTSLIYHYRWENRDTKAKNGYYFGAEATVSAILSPNFLIGPSIYYKKYNQEEVITPNVGSSKFQIGFNSLYKINKNNSITFEYVQDEKVRNRAEGKRYSLRYVYKFNKN